jgi:PAS domain S-box-containing protein
MIAMGARLEDILTALIHLIESQAEGLLCSILFLREGHLWHGVAPNLPATYVRAIDGLPVGPQNASCGTAAYRREPVIVSDILQDPLWDDYRHLAVSHGLRACWSTPFFSSRGEVLGTFAMYCSSPRNPASAETHLVNVATRIATIAVESWNSHEQLWRAAEEFRALVENLNDIVFSLDPEGNLTYISPPIERQTGHRPEELIGQPLSRLLHPDDLGVLRQSFAATLAGSLAHCELRVSDKQGQTRWVRSSSRPQIVQGQTVGLTGVIVDITEQKRSEDALREAERKYRSIFEDAVTGIFQSTPEGRYITANPALARILGYDSPEDLTASVTNIAEQIYVDPERRQEFKFLMEKDGGVREFEHEVYRKDGSRRWLRNSAQAVKRDGHTVYEGTSEDITERKLLSQELFQAQKMDAVGQLAGGIAHDFNNLLGVILGHGELLLQRLPSQDPSRRRIQQICWAAQRAVALTGQLLAFARRQKLQTTVLNLNELVTNLDDVVQRLIGENICVVNKLGPALGHVRADATQIEQVVLNLALNARDAMPQGGTLTIETSNVEVEGTAKHDRGLKKGRYILLSVRDTGTGMDQATLARIFEPFFTTKEPGKGTGLGLSTVYGIIQQSGGHIFAASQPGEGTAFHIYLPRTEEAAEVALPSDAGAVSAKREGETILLVEDAAPLREVTREFLEDSGYHVLEASGGNVALDVAGAHDAPISAMITDVVMPGVSGPVLAERLRSSRPQMKVLYVSAYADDMIFREGVFPAGDNFLRKPYTQHQLTIKLRQILDAATQSGSVDNHVCMASKRTNSEPSSPGVSG